MREGRGGVRGSKGEERKEREERESDGEGECLLDKDREEEETAWMSDWSVFPREFPPFSAFRALI